MLLAISPLSSAVETVVSSMVLSARVVGWADQTVFAACFIGTIAAIARCSSKGFNVSHRAALLCAAMVAIETGMGLTALAEAGAAHDLASVLLTVSSALRGVGVAVFQVLYVCELAQASSRERHFDALLPLALVVSAVATLGMWALSFLFGPWPTIIAMTVLPSRRLPSFPVALILETLKSGRRGNRPRRSICRFPRASSSDLSVWLKAAPGRCSTQCPGRACRSAPVWGFSFLMSSCSWRHESVPLDPSRPWGPPCAG